VVLPRQHLEEHSTRSHGFTEISEGNAVNSAREWGRVEIEKKSYLEIGHPKVGEDLSLMDGQHLFD
jgi:hypothetical protein